MYVYVILKCGGYIEFPKHDIASLVEGAHSLELRYSEGELVAAFPLSAIDRYYFGHDIENPDYVEPDARPAGLYSLGGVPRSHWKIICEQVSVGEIECYTGR